MLTSSTKKKIDNARDILVGKIPMPTSQVEQITLALIYKFMSDMDEKAKELGDSNGFFANGYEKYAWDELMNKALPARDRVKLYSEGLEKMSNNPHIPQLFRDIFKNAFLPFNDPETLKLFLDQIDQFSYDHSEELGNAFEYLLQVMGSQGDAGQFRTPRHIIDFIIEVIEPKKTDKILDPACGTAGFLISAYKYLKKQGLSADEMKQISNNFVGYDISQDMQRLSLVNMYLHHFPNPHIYEYDTLTSEDRWDDDFDVILANPPFMTPKGGIRPHNRFSVSSKRAEVLFTDYIMEHLNPKGKAGIIVPEGIIFQSQNAYKNLRKMMVEDNYLWAVVSLPSGVFNPYSGVKTSILLMDKEIAKKTDRILFFKVQNDGYDLGARRRKLNKPSDLEWLAQEITRKDGFKDALLKEGTIKNTKWWKAFGESEKGVKDGSVQEVSKKKIRESGDWNLSGERYKVNERTSNSNIPLAPIREISTLVTKGSTPTTYGYKYIPEGINFVKIESILDNGFFNIIKFQHISDEANLKLKRSILVKDDVLFSIAGALGKVAVVDKSILPANTNQALAIIRPIAEKVLSKYLFYILKSKRILLEIEKIKKGVAQYNLSLAQIKNFQIPLPPLSVQKEIVEELYRYQKIIDGAKQVVDKYRPEFEIDEDWKQVKLSELFNGLQAGVSVNSENSKKKEDEIGILKTSAVTYGVFNPKEHKAILQSEINRARINPQKDSIIISRMNTKALVGASVYVDRDYEDLFLPDRLWLATRNKKNFSMKYIFHVISSPKYRKIISNLCGGTSGSMKNISKKRLLSIKVPLPSIEAQKQIISQIQEEQELVDGNRLFIQKFEEKIKTNINRIWGK